MPPSRRLRSLVALGALTALAVPAAAGTAGAQTNGNPFVPLPTIPPTLPPRTGVLPDAAYDQARGAQAATSSGSGVWLAAPTGVACPSGVRFDSAPPLPPPPATVVRPPVARPPVAPTPTPRLPTKTVKKASRAAPGSASADSGSSSASGSATPANPGAIPATRAAAATTAAPATIGAAQPRPGDLGLKAGSTDDNSAFDDYLAYRRKFLTSGLFAHDMDVTERHVIRVVDEGGRPVLGAKVAITTSDGFPLVDLRTYADGRTLFFPRLSSRPGVGTWAAQISANGASTSVTFDRSIAGHVFTLPSGRPSFSQGQAPSGQSAPGQTPVKLDVQFLVDTTGSMQDEIDRLRANMIEISRQLSALPGRPDIRFGMTVYRDCGDAFISRTFDFAQDVNRFTSELQTVVADAGGDEPEHLNQALHDAITRAGWRGDDTIKLVFLVADAPPHLDYQNDVDYAIDSLLAARRGIKIMPVASSGSSPVAEYVFRQLAQLTTGKFVFLTYGADGVSAGDRTNLNVDGYETLALDQLVVRLATEEVTFQGADRPVLPPLPTGPPRSDAPIVPTAPPPFLR